MEKSVSQYIADINKRYRLGNATEHTFRGDLQQLMETLVPGIRATNEPKRQACGAPDYILTKKWMCADLRKIQPEPKISVSCPVITAWP